MLILTEEDVAPIHDQVWRQISIKVCNQAQVSSQVRDQVWSQVYVLFRVQEVRDQIYNQVYLQLHNQIRVQVRDQVWSQVYDAI
jgi:hypothetical protein